MQPAETTNYAKIKSPPNFKDLDLPLRSIVSSAGIKVFLKGDVELLRLLRKEARHRATYYYTDGRVAEEFRIDEDSSLKYLTKANNLEKIPGGREGHYWLMRKAGRPENQ